MDTTAARRLLDRLAVDRRTYASEDTILAAYDALDALYGTPAAEPRDAVRMSTARRLGGVL